MATVIASTYELVERIGSGGGGTVYLANHIRLNKKVVLKADKRKLTTRPDLLRREVDILKELNHSYIPQVYDFFIEDETVYTAMDFIDGESLDKPLKKGEKFPQPQVIKWAKQLLEALDYLHRPIHGDPPRGYVHSDIKPANIMRTPHNDICLIDFNIALALGEENVVGCSAGYASPEHYGLDYSSFGGDTATLEGSETVTLLDETVTLTLSDGRSSGPSAKKIIPDVRSDIYSLGATLYHLLSGQRPAKNAMEVVPLSEREFSPQLVGIISKAMNPNPELRFQSASEMLDAFLHLHKNDPRNKKLRRANIVSSIIVAFLFVVGAASAFVGLKRMQVTESWLKLAEYSQSALDQGDSVSAIQYALDALPQKKNLLTPTCIPEAQKALTDALGVYNLSDGFKKHRTVELPSNPLYLVVSPDGRTSACIYSGAVAVFDTNTAEILYTLPADRSALSEIEYLANDIIIYAGQNGVTAFDIVTGTELWTGQPGTAISISRDGTLVAAVYRDEPYATIYNAQTGNVECRVDFSGKHQSVTVNDIFANPNDNLFELNEDGTCLAVSFSDGSLEVYNLIDADNNIEILDNTSGYTHFEGGFYHQYLAFSATGKAESVFAVIDTIELIQTGGFSSDGYFGTATDENGIYVQTENLLVKVDPVTGEQTPLVTTSQNISRFAVSATQTLATSQEEVMFFDSNATMIASFTENEAGDLVQLANGIALIGSIDTPIIKILRYEGHPQSEVFEYDPGYAHDEARISADGQTITLFNYKQFRIYAISGELVAEVDVPDAKQVFDQQYIRTGGQSYLEVTYNDGMKLTYNARDGTLVSKQQGEVPDSSLYEEFVTDTLKIASPLHGSPTAYDLKSGKVVREFDEEGYLTYITQVGDYIVAQYITTDEYHYGTILNKKCEKLATLPYLSDVVDDTLFFDYPDGKIKQSHIYAIDELIHMGQNELKGGN